MLRKIEIQPPQGSVRTSALGLHASQHDRPSLPFPAVPVPLFDTSTPLEPLRPKIIERLTAVVNQGRYILGPEVQAFEREFAEYLGVGHVVGVANGTDALTIGLRAAAIGPGDEVVVPSFTFY